MFYSGLRNVSHFSQSANKTRTAHTHGTHAVRNTFHPSMYQTHVHKQLPLCQGYCRSISGRSIDSYCCVNHATWAFEWHVTNIQENQPNQKFDAKRRKNALIGQIRNENLQNQRRKWSYQLTVRNFRIKNRGGSIHPRMALQPLPGFGLPQSVPPLVPVFSSSPPSCYS
jgi:hypothetical protein